MRERPKDKHRLLHILEAIDNIFEFTRGINFEVYKNNKVLRFAVIKNLEIIGEAAYLLTTDFKEGHLETDWDTIVYMRHILVHGYYQINDEIIWATIQSDLQPLKLNIESYIRELE